MSDVDAVRFLASEHNLEFVDLERHNVDQAVADILPEELAAVIETARWEVPSLFSALQRLGDISEEEMWATFNMGIGMICVVPPATADQALSSSSSEVMAIGEIVARQGRSRVVLR